MAVQIDMEVYDSRGKYVDALKDHNGLTMTDDDTGKGVAKQSWADFSGSGLEDPYGLTAVHIKYRDPILTSVFDELKKNISAGDRGFASDEIGALKTLGVTFQKIGDGRGGDARTKSVSTKVMEWFNLRLLDTRCASAAQKLLITSTEKVEKHLRLNTDLHLNATEATAVLPTNKVLRSLKC